MVTIVLWYQDEVLVALGTQFCGHTREIADSGPLPVTKIREMPLNWK
jgi:hypothetical protein